MKEILRASSHGEAEVLKIEPLAQGIDAVTRGDLTLGVVGGGLSVWVMNDDDEQRAIQIMKALEGDDSPPPAAMNPPTSERAARFERPVTSTVGRGYRWWEGVARSLCAWLLDSAKRRSLITCCAPSRCHPLA